MAVKIRSADDVLTQLVETGAHRPLLLRIWREGVAFSRLPTFFVRFANENDITPQTTYLDCVTPGVSLAECVKGIQCSFVVLDETGVAVHDLHSLEYKLASSLSHFLGGHVALLKGGAHALCEAARAAKDYHPHIQAWMSAILPVMSDETFSTATTAEIIPSQLYVGGVCSREIPVLQQLKIRRIVNCVGPRTSHLTHHHPHHHHQARVLNDNSNNNNNNSEVDGNQMDRRFDDENNNKQEEDEEEKENEEEAVVAAVVAAATGSAAAASPSESSPSSSTTTTSSSPFDSTDQYATPPTPPTPPYGQPAFANYYCFPPLPEGVQEIGLALEDGDVIGPEVLKTVADFVDEGFERGEAVLIHCLAGVNRSVTVTLCYLMMRKKLSLLSAFQALWKSRPVLNPWRQNLERLLEVEKEIHGEKREEEGGGERACFVDIHAERQWRRVQLLNFLRLLMEQGMNEEI